MSFSVSKSYSFNSSSITTFHRLWLCKMLIVFKTFFRPCHVFWCSRINQPLSLLSQLTVTRALKKKNTLIQVFNIFLHHAFGPVSFLFLFSIWKVMLFMSFFSTLVTGPCAGFVISHCLRIALHIATNLCWHGWSTSGHSITKPIIISMH